MDKLMDCIDRNKGKLVNLSGKIHSFEEVAFKEHKSANYICDFLEKEGFSVEREIGQLDTAFKASAGSKDGLKVALLAEYDALPQIGHGCGHNVISAVTCGAAIALKSVLDDLDGQVVVIGTPAEESGGGKIILLENGVFDDIDFAMMIHPSDKNLVNRGGTAVTTCTIDFKGLQAHSSTPGKGINALKALVNTLIGIDQISGEFPVGANHNAIITNGGIAPNIVPDYATSEICVRAKTLKDLKVVLKRIEEVVEGATKVTRATSDYTFTRPYSERYSNLVMDDVFKEIMESFGEEVKYPEPDIRFGSSDIGNVSLVMPIIHPYVKIGNKLRSHSEEFAEAAISKDAEEMIVKASKALAGTAYRLLTEKGLREQALDEFNRVVPKY